MREIKFRAWEISGGHWMSHEVSGFLLFNFFIDGSGKFTIDEMNPMSENVKSDGDRDYIIQQYTGLKDKNGAEIYEGDICKTFGLMDNIIGEVVFKDCGWRLLTLAGWSHSKSFSNGLIGSLEVIGNIYENPELLKED